VTYIKWRLYTHEGQRDRGTEAEAERPRHGKGGKTVLLYLISLICTILAMKTKEIAFMLPVMLTLYEMIFFKGKIKKRVLYLIPFLVTMLIIPLSLMSISMPIGELIGDFDESVKGNTELSRGEYLLAQFRVLVTYMRLIFLPVNQNLDYDYPRYYSFFNMEVFSSFAFLTILFGFSIYMLFRYRDSAPYTRLISFGIIWFFVNLVLESSVIPLNNVIFEHRMYLPSVGVFSALTVIIFMVINRWKAYARLITVMLVVIIVALTGSTYARNSVWKDELTLWQDVVNKSPNKVRGYLNLGRGYSLQGYFDEAIKQFRLVLKFDPTYSKAYYNLGHILQKQGLTDSAVRHYQKAVQIDPTYSDAHYNLAEIFRMRGLTDIAIRHYQKVIHFDPVYSEAYNNLGNIYSSQGLIDMAIEHYQTAIKINRYYHDAHYNLGNTYASEGLIDKAIEQYLLAIELMPDHPTSHHNLGVVYKYKGMLDKAIEHYLLAIEFKPDYPEAHHSLGVAYKSQGKIELAIRAYNDALRLRPGWELPLAELEQINKER
jgi:tetratricopeptide (TPR) repeat protein